MPCIRAYLRQPRSTVEECRSTPPGSRHQCERRRGNAISCAPARLAARDEEKARRRLGEGRAYGSASSLIVVIVDVVVHAFGHNAFLLVAALETLRWGHEGETLVVVVVAGRVLVWVRVQIRARVRARARAGARARARAGARARDGFGVRPGLPRCPSSPLTTHYLLLTTYYLLLTTDY